MKFLCRWNIPQENWLRMMKAFTSMSLEEQKDIGKGVTIIGRWHNVAARTGVAVVEAVDLFAVQCYIAQKSAYMDIDIAPVLDDEELTTIGRQILDGDNS